MAFKTLADLETLFTPSYTDSEAKFKVFYNVDDICHDLDFNIFDLTSDPVLTDHREDRPKPEEAQRDWG
jgi:hypothetical protein